VLERLAFRREMTTTFIAVSQNVVEDMEHLYHVPQERMLVIPNGYDPHQCSASRRLSLRDGRRKELGLSPDDLALLLVANEYHRKGLAVLLEAMAEIGDGRLKLFLVGRMSPAAYVNRIKELGLQERVRYCGPTNDVSEYHAAADLFVLPTQYEAFGSVIVEALASGLPVITTALAGAAVVIREDVNGLLLRDPHSSEELARSLQRASQPGVLERWSSAAPGSVSGYEWAAVMKRFEDALSAVANSSL
jgi:UDP-glucose:(heptosyl)LPS alpha-1,3-glucosyltransferase